VHDIEQRLRRDLREFTERLSAESIRPLREPVASRRRRAVRWLAPVTAMAAVVGVVAAVSLASQPSGPPPAGLPVAPPTPVPSGQAPAYYVTLDETDSTHGITNYAVVHDSATGAVLATRTFPTLPSVGGGAQAPSLTAAADDRTFVITNTGQVQVGSATRTITHKTRPSPHFPHGRTITAHVPAHVANTVKFLLLKVAADGRSATLTTLPLSLPGSFAVDGVALSPDGSRLAIAAQACQSFSHCRYTGIRVVTLTTGATSNWTASLPGAAQNPSWFGNEHVMFSWQYPGPNSGYRLLNVAGAGGNLLAAPLLPALPAQPYGNIPPALITPDGRAIVTDVVVSVPGRDGHTTAVAKIIELSASTGQLIRVLHVMPASAVYNATNAGSLEGDCTVQSLGPSGLQALVQCPGFGSLNGAGRFTALAGVPDDNQQVMPGPYIWGTGAW
jgi:hypothetical protein